MQASYLGSSTVSGHVCRCATRQYHWRNEGRCSLCVSKYGSCSYHTPQTSPCQIIDLPSQGNPVSRNGHSRTGSGAYIEISARVRNCQDTLILKHIQSSPENYTIKIISRETSTAEFPEGVTVTRVPDTYPVDKLTEAFQGIDVVIASVSMMGMGEQYNFINACLAAGVKRYFPTEFGLDELPDWLLQLREMFKIKHDVRDYLIAHEGKGLEWTSICCNAFFEMGVASGFFQFDWKNKKAVLVDGGTALWVATTLDTVAIAVLKAIEKPAISRNRILLVQDFQTSQKQILDAVQKKVPVWEVESVDGDAWLEKGKEAVREGDNSQLRKLTIGSFVKGNKYEGREGFGNEVLGVPSKSFDEAMDMFWSENESLLKA